MLLPNVERKIKMAKKFNITPKSLIDEVLWHEATSIRDDEPYLADILVKLKLIEPIWEGGTTESDAMCWLEKEPPLKEKLLVLKEMGYDLSILNLEK